MALRELKASQPKRVLEVRLEGATSRDGHRPECDPEVAREFGSGVVDQTRRD